MKNTIVKWQNDNYDLGCNIKELEKLGFVNSSYHHDVAPSYELKDKIQIFFADLNDEGIKYEGIKTKFIINKIDQKTGDLIHIFSTNNFKEVLRIVSFSKSLSNI